MSVIYCEKCDKQIDTDFEAEHFMDNQSISVEKGLRDLAEYLGCNEDELVSEGVKLVNTAVVEARIDELERLVGEGEAGDKYRTKAEFGFETVQMRIAILKQQLKEDTK